MTLSTDVYVLDPVSPREVFEFCQKLLAKYDEQHRPVSAQKWEDTESYRDNGDRAFRNQPCQGLPAWLWVHYNPDGALKAVEGCGNECDPEDGPCEGTWHKPPHWINVDFDTAYGYRDSAGRRCGDLHALMVAELGHWLQSKGVRWAWQNEFTGEIHVGPERLGELCSGGAEAADWYRNTALPVIVSEIAARQS